MRLKSLGDLGDAFDDETSWRKRELTNILFYVQTERAAKQPTAIRAGITLLYAHWEGWIKRIAKLYIEFVWQQRLRYDELSEPFLGLALKSQIEDLEQANKARVHGQFAAFIRNDLGSRATLGSPNAIRTESNLSSRVLEDIVTRLGLSYAPYAGFAALIDQRMLDRRNTIAHGEYLDIGISEYEALHREVRDLLNQLTNDILNRAALREYKK